MKSILPHCISNTQAAFVQGRAITDNILVAHEIVHTLHTSASRSSQGVVFKLDMEKAFDRVEWPFLEAVMLRLGFAPSWVDLIMRCVSSVSSRVRVRGALSEAFRPQCGLRQGDPLSPFLFLFCMEGISAALTAVQHEGRLPGVRASKHGPPVNHLLFADDSLVFLRNNMSEVHCLKDILSAYSIVSDQKVNFSKSTAYFSPRTPSAHRIAVHEALGVQEVDDPGIYLGALPQYVMSCYLLPCSLVEEMSRSRARLVGSARGWPVVAWDDICLPKTTGGIGFKDLHLFNIALLGKQIWRLLSAPGSLLFRTLRAKYFPDGDLLSASAPTCSSFAWKARWDRPKLLAHLSPGDVDSILEVPISPDRADTLIWGDHDSSLYTVRSGYLFLRRPPSPSARLCGSPSCGLRLRDAGLSAGACPLCGAGLEDVLHVLCDCPDSYTALRQAGFADSLFSAAWAMSVDWLGFAASSLSLSSTLFRFVMTMHRRLLPPRSPPSAADPPRWRPPLAGSVKINVDGAFLPSACLGAIGVIARDSSGAVLGGFAKPVPIHGPTSSMEVSALFAGLEFSIAKDWPSALIESDVVVLVNKLHWPTVDLSFLGDLLAPSSALLAANNGRLRVGFASRSANIAAHTLASWACHNDNVILFSSVCPELISRIVLDDLSSSFNDISGTIFPLLGPRLALLAGFSWVF
ncbi:hypothetical protein GQ457_03G016860 [Hibiscus cannabinus]